MRKRRENLKENFKILKEKQETTNQGITLIALVVTIVVLLILASVSITVVFGDNGILQLAKEAGEKTNEAKDKDLRQIAMAEAAMNFETKEYKGVTIPAGFAPTRIEGEDSINDGLVIIDSEGNEFVWIPVKSKNEYTKKIGKYNQENVDEFGTEILGDCLGITNILGTEIGSGVQEQPEADIVVNAGGFYVGRYEAGVEVNGKINWDEKPKIVVKKNVQPARGLLYNEMLDLANKFKINKDVQSGLITGTEWDMMCKFIGWEIADGDCSGWANYRVTKSSIYSGYYATKSNLEWTFGKNIVKAGSLELTDDNIWIFPTGMFLTEAGLNTAQKNIYDIAGNVTENTTEVFKLDDLHGGTGRVGRGANAWFGDENNDGGRATYRKNESATWWARKDGGSGFRLVLYVKK